MPGPTKSPDDVQSEQIGVRLTVAEANLLDRAIAYAERAAGLVPGSISRGAYIRSGLMRHLQSILEAAGDQMPAADPAMAAAVMVPKLRHSAPMQPQRGLATVRLRSKGKRS